MGRGAERGIRGVLVGAWLGAAIGGVNQGCAGDEQAQRDAAPDEGSQSSIVPATCAITLPGYDYQCAVSWPDLAELEGGGGMGGMGGSSALADDSSDATAEGCLVSQLLSVHCPSYVSHWSLARGSTGTLAVALAQKGTDALDEYATARPDGRAHLSTYVVDGAGVEVEQLESIAEGGSLALAVVPQTKKREFGLLFNLSMEGAQPTSRFEFFSSSGSAEPFQLEQPPPHGGRLRVISNGEGTDLIYAETAPPWIVMDLFGEQEALTLSGDDRALAVDVERSGQVLA